MKRLRLFLATVLCLVPLGLAAAGPTAGAISIFPSQVCKSQNGQNQTTLVCQQKNEQAKNGDDPVITALRITIIILSYIIGVSAVIGLIIAGIRMITSVGDPQGFNRARSAVIYCLIGLAIVIVAQVIVAFVLDKI